MRKLNLLLLFLCLIPSAHAEKRVVNLDEVINLALLQSETMGISKAQVEISELTIKKAYSNLYPTISVEGKVLKNATRPVITPVHLAKNEVWQQSAEIVLTQPIYTFGRLSGAIGLAKYQEKLTDNLSIATKADVISTAQKLFYTVLFYKENVKATTDSFNNALQNEKALNKRVGLGRTSQNDNLKMKADIASRKPQMIEAKKLHESSLLELKNFLALDEDVELEVQGRLESNIKPQNKNFDLNNLANIKILNNELKLQESLAEITKSDFWPTLGFFASYSDTATYKEFQKDNFQNQENVSFGISLNFSFELGGGKNRNYEISNVETRIKKLKYEQGRRTLQMNLKKLSDEYKSLEEQLAANKTALNLAENSYKVALNSFANGSNSQTQLNDSELLLTNNKINYSRTLLLLQNAKIELDKLRTEGK